MQKKRGISNKPTTVSASSGSGGKRDRASGQKREGTSSTSSSGSSKSRSDRKKSSSGSIPSRHATSPAAGDSVRKKSAPIVCILNCTVLTSFSPIIQDKLGTM